MDIKNGTKIKLFYIILISSVLCLFFAGFMVHISLFPDNIYIVKDDDNDISLNFPLNAKIEPVSLYNINIDDQMDDIYSRENSSDEVKTSAKGESGNITVTALGLPLKKVSLNIVNEMEVIPAGITVGVKIDTEGVLVLGTGYVTGIDGQAHRPSEGLLKPGDMLLTANGKQLSSKEELVAVINQNSSAINFTLKREDEILQVSVTPVIASESNSNKIGLWVRDSTQGIGTITYYNPETNKFGALGHGIIDVDTRQLISVKNGILMETDIKSIKKGKKGAPGELVGDINRNNVIGSIKLNNAYGLYGNIYENSEFMNSNPIKIGLQNEVHEGPAIIRANIEGNEVKDYDIFIESVNKFSSDDSKGMVIRITDTELLSKTNGIVQGMSGSPIIQNNKLIGAVTHVFVQDPGKGYGIFIENMLKQEILFSQAD